MKITHFRPPGRNCPAFEVLSQFSLLLCIFPHTFITSQDTNAVGFRANSRDTVFPNLCLRQQQFSQWDRAESRNHAITQDNSGCPFTVVAPSISAKLPEKKK